MNRTVIHKKTGAVNIGKLGTNTALALLLVSQPRFDDGWRVSDLLGLFGDDASTVRVSLISMGFAERNRSVDGLIALYNLTSNGYAVASEVEKGLDKIGFWSK